MRVLLIASGAYCEQGLRGELGALPPAFLPVANRRLFQHQVGADWGDGVRKFMTLPLDFVIDSVDEDDLDKRGVTIIRQREDLDLREAIVAALASIREAVGSLMDIDEFTLLHGDTLIDPLPSVQSAIFAIGHGSPEYTWARVEVDNDGAIRRVYTPRVTETGAVTTDVIAGAFSIRHLSTFAACLALGRDFVDALDIYVNEVEVLAHRPATWLDFGHLHTYFSSRRIITTERAFNVLRIEGRVVRKLSSRPGRIEAESHWYTNVPRELRHFVPAYLGKGESWYEIEYLHLSPLSDLFVFGRLDEAVWNKVFEAVFDFLAQCHARVSNAEVDHAALAMKTRSRWDEYASVANPDAELCLEVARLCDELNNQEPRPQTFVHGDFCASNILYDFRSQSIRVIDPRGESFSGVPTVFGDPLYDLAKLMHSFMGLYDLVIGDRLTMNCRESRAPGLSDFWEATPWQRGVQTAFMRQLRTYCLSHDWAVDDVRRLAASLFFSMPPLHDDSARRQRALVAAGTRLLGGSS